MGPKLPRKHLPNRVLLEQVCVVESPLIPKENVYRIAISQSEKPSGEHGENKTDNSDNGCRSQVDARGKCSLNGHFRLPRCGRGHFGRLYCQMVNFRGGVANRTSFLELQLATTAITLKSPRCWVLR